MAKYKSVYDNQFVQSTTSKVLQHNTSETLNQRRNVLIYKTCLFSV